MRRSGVSVVPNVIASTILEPGLAAPSLIGVDRVVEGNSKLAVSSSSAEIAGPALTGMLIQWLTAPIAILFDAASFMLSAI